MKKYDPETKAQMRSFFQTLSEKDKRQYAANPTHVALRTMSSNNRHTVVQLVLFTIMLTVSIACLRHRTWQR